MAVQFQPLTALSACNADSVTGQQVTYRLRHNCGLLPPVRPATDPEPLYGSRLQRLFEACQGIDSPVGRQGTGPTKNATGTADLVSKQ